MYMVCFLSIKTIEYGRLPKITDIMAQKTKDKKLDQIRYHPKDDRIWDYPQYVRATCQICPHRRAVRQFFHRLWGRLLEFAGPLAQRRVEITSNRFFGQFGCFPPAPQGRNGHRIAPVNGGRTTLDRFFFDFWPTFWRPCFTSKIDPFLELHFDPFWPQNEPKIDPKSMKFGPGTPSFFRFVFFIHFWYDFCTFFEIFCFLDFWKYSRIIWFLQCLLHVHAWL